MISKVVYSVWKTVVLLRVANKCLQSLDIFQKLTVKWGFPQMVSMNTQNALELLLIYDLVYIVRCISVWSMKVKETMSSKMYTSKPNVFNAWLRHPHCASVKHLSTYLPTNTHTHTHTVSMIWGISCKGHLDQFYCNILQTYTKEWYN